MMPGRFRLVRHGGGRSVTVARGEEFDNGRVALYPVGGPSVVPYRSLEALRRARLDGRTVIRWEPGAFTREAY